MLQPKCATNSCSPDKLRSSSAHVLSTFLFINLRATTYYHTDGVGTSRIVSQGAGWPVWQGTFAPYGQEISPQMAVDNNKFAMYQHETESNLDHATFIKYSPIQARFTSPDPYIGSVDIENPQSWK